MNLPWKTIVSKKRESLEANIPEQWRLAREFIPESLPSIDDSVTATTFEKVNVMDVPRICGIMGQKELAITERWDVRGLLHELHCGRLTAFEVCQAFCKRAAITHQVTRCLTEPLFQDALERASDLDSHFANTHEPVGPLHGLPVSIKDCFDIKGVDSSIGMTYHAFKPAKTNAPIVDLLRSLGAVIIAKTNVPQFVGAFDSVNYIFGRTMNPLNYNLSAGGSSGGEAALVAMRGSMAGIGTDFGGSIRVPAMCCGLYGLKPSTGRFPNGGQSSLNVPGKERMVVKAAAGPIARSLDDIRALMEAVVPNSAAFGTDCIPGQWNKGCLGMQKNRSSKFTFGVVRHDGLAQPLPPIARIVSEVVDSLNRLPDVEVVEIPTPEFLPRCQGLANRLNALDGAHSMFDKVESMSEPLIPWIKSRMRRGKQMTLDQILELQAQRDEIEQEALTMWRTPSGATIDAIVHPIAPHPVTEIDKFNVMSYTIHWTVLDYPAATVPIRTLKAADLEIGKEINTKPLGSWDKKNRDLWDTKAIDRRVYLDSPLSVQVIAPRLHEFDLCEAMALIERSFDAGDNDRSSKL